MYTVRVFGTTVFFVSFLVFFYCQLSIILQITKVVVIVRCILGSDISFSVYLKSQYNSTPGLCTTRDSAVLVDRIRKDAL